MIHNVFILFLLILLSQTVATGISVHSNSLSTPTKYSHEYRQKILTSNNTKVLKDVNNTSSGSIQLVRMGNKLIMKHKLSSQILELFVGNQSLIVQRYSSKPTLSLVRDLQTSTNFDAVFGIVHLKNELALILVKGSENSFEKYHRLSIFQGVRKVTEFEVVLIPKINCSYSNIPEDIQSEKQALLKFLHEHPFYYCIHAGNNARTELVNNMIHSQQRQYFIHEKMQQEKERLITSRTGHCRWLWNEPCSSCFNAYPLFKFDFINAGVEVHRLAAPNMTSSIECFYILIARRSRLKQGFRYIQRGCDLTGNAANYAESEQLLIQRSSLVNPKVEEILSFSQIRGSIPFVWRQSAAASETENEFQSRRGRVNISGDDPINQEVMRSHIRSVVYENILQVDHSTDVVFLNLIDKNGEQGALGRSFLRFLTLLQRNSSSNSHDRSEDLSGSVTRGEITAHDFQIPMRHETTTAAVRFIWFDYHYMMRSSTNASRDNHPLFALHRHLRGVLQHRRNFKDDAPSTGAFFHATKFLHSGAMRVHSLQRSVIRTNCMDCLDRTNVMQSSIARWVFMQQLSVLRALQSPRKKSFPCEFVHTIPITALERLFREAWLHHGDFLSRLYAGSNAMKRDVVLSGRRTGIGAFHDLLSYFSRQFQEHFIQTRKQRLLNRLLQPVACEQSEVMREVKEFAVNVITLEKAEEEEVEEEEFVDLDEVDQQMRVLVSDVCDRLSKKTDHCFAALNNELNQLLFEEDAEESLANTKNDQSNSSNDSDVAIKQENNSTIATKKTGIREKSRSGNAVAFLTSFCSIAASALIALLIV